eukprot:124204-Pleurochrysis_carterae.AAC.3
MLDLISKLARVPTNLVAPSLAPPDASVATLMPGHRCAPLRPPRSAGAGLVTAVPRRSRALPLLLLAPKAATAGAAVPLGTELAESKSDELASSSGREATAVWARRHTSGVAVESGSAVADECSCCKVGAQCCVGAILIP